MDMLSTAPLAAPSAAQPGANGRLAPADTALAEAIPATTPCFAGLLGEACAALDGEAPHPEGVGAAAEALAAPPEEGSLLSLMQAPAALPAVQPQLPVPAPVVQPLPVAEPMPAGIGSQTLASPLGGGLAAPASAVLADSAPQSLSLAEVPASATSIAPDASRVTLATPPMAGTGAPPDLMASPATPALATAAAHVINAPASGAVPSAEANVAPALLGTAAQAMASAAQAPSKSPSATPGANNVAAQPAGPRAATLGIAVEPSASAAPSRIPEPTPVSLVVAATIPAPPPQDLIALIAGLVITEPPAAEVPAQGRIGADPVNAALPAAAPAQPPPATPLAAPAIASPLRAAMPVAWPARQIAPFAVALALGPNASLTVTLDPVELGRVEVSIERSGAEAAIRVVAERPETLALLQRDAKELQRALSDAGVGQNGTSLSFSLGNGGASQQEARHGAARRDAAPLLAPGLPASLSKSFLAPHQAADQRGLLDLAV